ncbi:MAG: hypothetical protein IRZ03_19210 [Acidobacterium ailaaui]|nr:hypothetical protein [Pseudacidobacterium ailaaui]
MILPLFDMQFGQLVRPEDTPGGCGGFNSDVFRKRFDRYVQAVGANALDYAHSHTIENVAFVFGGDMVEGDGTIYRGQSWQLEMDAAEQVVRLKDILASGLDELIGLFKEEIGVKRIAVFWIPGNHGKAGGKRAGATPATLSYDYLLGRWMQETLKNYPVDRFVVEPGGEILFDSRGWIFRVIHGDEVRGWGGIPFYGLTRMDAAAVRLHNIVFDYLLLGHHHRAASIPIGAAEHLMSGDWVGHNNMARTGSAPLGRPSQWQYFVAKEYGVCDRSLIQLTLPDEIRRPDIYRLTPI